MTQIKVNGKKTFQPNLINWSYLNLGTDALTQIKINKQNIIFKINQINPGIKFKNSNLNGGNQPPINNNTVKELIKIIFAYSPRKNNANGIDEYSTL